METQTKSSLLSDGEREQFREVFAQLAKVKNPPKSLLEFLQRLPAWTSGDYNREHLGHILRSLDRALIKSQRDHDFLICEGDSQKARAPALPLFFLLENLQSAFNVGSVFRTADFVGAEKIFLAGFTPSPAWPQVQKTSMGTSKTLPWQRLADSQTSLQQLRDQQPEIRWIAIETTRDAKDYSEPFGQTPTLFLFGNERHGLSSEALSLADEFRCLRSRGHKNSLNVGVALATLGFEWQRQWLINSVRSAGGQSDE